MTRSASTARHIVATTCVAVVHGVALAQPAPAANPHGALPTRPAQPVVTESPRDEPGTRRIVIEDDTTRIEELHVRGEAQRVVVRSKRVNLPAWEIRPDSPGRAVSGETRLPRDTANTRMWRVWSF
jgi:hypothetical protein